ncbi:AfsR/SARP family transcriptional regulator [Streptomyces noursei]|uniref:AfsR/SARP family transcriptional regulator n=1 Tax=Streptomyces noursei TaxID=1971 RepID=UPI001963C357|nr:AfsR/SARP family transcriptional regulator [Streptomyces noursei]QRX93534.1 AfsR/SARP family transcriptional regulator [Streptomyces noursei]
MTGFGVLGPLELHTAHGVRTLRGPKLRKVLALLLSRAGHFVPIDLLMDELWAGRRPDSAVMTVRTHVYHLRKQLAAEEFAGMAQQPVIESRPNGYLLRLSDGALDSAVFAQQARLGGELLHQGRVAEAADALRAALALWRGPALEGVACGPVLDGYVARLEEQRQRALEKRLEADAQLGRHREIICELRTLVAANPFNEWLHTRLIDALRCSGRRAEALGAYQKLCALLESELGLEPSMEVRRIRCQILGRAA